MTSRNWRDIGEEITKLDSREKCMAGFTPLLPPVPLPTTGALIEHATFDAKARADLGKTFHLAKDVAAFANHLGGNLLIGVPEVKGVLQAPVPMTARDASDVRNAFSKEVATRCSPPPLLDFAEYPVGSGVVVSVVVFPYVGQVVGVRVSADPTKGGYAGDAFAFPVRVGADSVYLKPEQLSMLMLPEYRRVVVALGAMKKGDLVHLLGVPATGQMSTAQCVFFAADVLTNTLTLDPPPQGGAGAVLTQSVSIPIDYVRTVWTAPDGWHVGVRGSFTNKPGGFIPALV